MIEKVTFEKCRRCGRKTIEVIRKDYNNGHHEIRKYHCENCDEVRREQLKSMRERPAKEVRK